MLLTFSPNHLVHNAHIALDDLHDLVGDIRIRVVRHRDRAAVLFILYHFYCCINRLKKAFGIDAGQDKAGLVKGFGALRGSADTHSRDRMTNGSKETAFLRKGS